MLVSVLLLIFGFVILIKGADFFVDGASGIATNLKLSKMLIGLTIVSFGTSAPEFAVSIKSLLVGSGDIVLGNVIGSNILNILLIIGCSAVVHSLIVKNNTVKKELPIVMLITVLFAVLLSDSLFDNVKNSFTRSDGIVLILFFGAIASPKFLWDIVDIGAGILAIINCFSMMKLHKEIKREYDKERSIL